jgi:hypothetical protein
MAIGSQNNQYAETPDLRGKIILSTDRWYAVKD